MQSIVSMITIIVKTQQYISRYARFLEHEFP